MPSSTSTAISSSAPCAPNPPTNTWPSPTQPTSPSSTCSAHHSASWFRGRRLCRLITTADRCTVAIVSSAEHGMPGTTYLELAHELVLAAHAADVKHVVHIVA